MMLMSSGKTFTIGGEELFFQQKNELSREGFIFVFSATFVPEGIE